MRMKRGASLIGALALVGALAIAGIASAGEETQNGVTQTLEGTVKPKKLPKKSKDAKDVSLKVAVGISDSNGMKPPPADQVDIKFDRDLQFNTKKVPECDENSIATANDATARQTCKKALVGTGSASATCSNNPTPDIPDVVVSAFNGEPQGKNPVLLLHTDATLGGTQQTQILPGVLKKNKGIKRAKKGYVLEVTVPPLAGGACSIVDFETTVGKGEIKKKYSDYVQATCSDKKISFGSEFNYVQGASNPQGVSSLSPTDEVKCKKKK